MLSFMQFLSENPKIEKSFKKKCIKYIQNQ